MKLNSVFLYSLLALSIAILTMNTKVYAQNQNNVSSERWFEIEVILFKQLGDKTELKEQFPAGINASNLPKYKESFDLLGEYLQPNLTGIKQFMPLCGEQNKQHELLTAQHSINSLFSKQIELPEKIISFAMPESTKLKFTENTQTTVNEHHEQMNSAHFELNFQKEDLTKPIFSTDKLCIITQKEMEKILDQEQLSHFNIDSFDVAALPSRLNAMGIHNGESPYLMADESLLLEDIYQNLRWSREFQPLLHFGWRQVGITEKDAIPLKLFAGEHIENQYQKALTEYQTEVKKANNIESNLLEQLSQNQEVADDKLKISLTRKQDALTQLFSKIDAIEKNTPSKVMNSLNHDETGNSEINKNNLAIDKDTISDIINGISKQDLNSLIAQHDPDNNQGNDLLKPNNPPKAPLQPWFLDGFLKVHLDHYLYITADFNLFNQDPISALMTNLGENNKAVLETNTHSATEGKADEMKLINFSQNRRVITGEIHYFDHPYIGMIVQIRRFDPTQPKGERVSQAIK